MMQKLLFFVSKLTNFCNYVLFEPNDVKIYQHLQVTSTPIIQWRILESIYVILAQRIYLEKKSSNETYALWHARAEHVSYNKLKIMMQQEN